MRRLSRVLLLLVLASAPAVGASGQEPGPGQPQEVVGFELQQNYPNPLNPETRIPFVLGEDLFAAGEPVVVSMRIYNLLTQFVAAPTALNHPAGDVALIQLEYGQPGRHVGYWDGRDQNGSEVASGVYFVQLEVNGASTTRRMFVAK